MPEPLRTRPSKSAIGDDPDGTAEEGLPEAAGLQNAAAAGVWAAHRGGEAFSAPR